MFFTMLYSFHNVEKMLAFHVRKYGRGIPDKGNLDYLTLWLLQAGYMMELCWSVYKVLIKWVTEIFSFSIVELGFGSVTVTFRSPF
jgi:hypothetical protein